MFYGFNCIVVVDGESFACVPCLFSMVSIAMFGWSGFFPLVLVARKAEALLKRCVSVIESFICCSPLAV